MREGDKVIGVDADIAQAVADKMGVELVVEDMEFDALPAALESGKIDFIAAGFTKNAEREATMDFSDEYFTAVQVVVEKEGNAVGISTEEDLKGKKIGVQTALPATCILPPRWRVLMCSAMRTSRWPARIWWTAGSTA